MVDKTDRRLQSPAQSVIDFYDAISSKNPERLAELADEFFAEDIFVELPDSLPYGGRVEDARRLRAMFVAMAAGRVEVGPRGLALDALTDGGDRVVARLSFDWYPPGGGLPMSSGAMEEWSFVAGKVASIRAYYSDTAALGCDR